MGSKVQLKGEVNGMQFVQTRWMIPQTGFASQNENIIHFGLPRKYTFQSLLVVWPSGVKQQINSLPLNRMVEITEPDT